MSNFLHTDALNHIEKHLMLEISALFTPQVVKTIQMFLTHKNYLNEVSFNEDDTQKWYTHKKLRSAYSSLKRNLPYLFTVEQNRELKMPNTTNMLEDRFGELKTKKRCYSDMIDETK